MQQVMRRLVAARELVSQDILAGLGILVKRTLLLTGVAVITLGALWVAKPELQVAVKRAAAESFASMSQTGAVWAAQLSAQVAADAAAAGQEVRLPAALLVGVPAMKYSELPSNQQAAALFLARKYRLAPDAIAGIVSEAYRTGQDLKLDPLLILAVMSIESSMNPFAQSSVGAQGLMQVMTSVHEERFEEFGGPHAALNPIANIRVGAEILRELLNRFGSPESALKAYVGAADHPHDGGYGLRVLTERARLEAAVTGQPFKPPVLQQTVMVEPGTATLAVPTGVPADGTGTGLVSPMTPSSLSPAIPETAKKDGAV